MNAQAREQMSGTPLVSIYMPTKNRAALLKRAAISVLRQSIDSFELVIVDDGSDDETPSVLSELARMDPRVRILRNVKSIGGAASRNRAIIDSKGLFLTGLDDDDYVSENHLQVLLNTYEAVKSDASLVFPLACLITKGGQKSLQQPKDVVTFNDLMISNKVGNQVFARREVFFEAGLFDPQMPAWQDYDLWLRMARGKGAFYRARVPTYFCDQSSEVPRISDKDPKKIFTAYERCCEKNLFDRSNKDRLRLRLNYHRYPQVSMAGLDLLDYYRVGIVGGATLLYLRKRLKRFRTSRTRCCRAT